jgi:hypothetical protein
MYNIVDIALPDTALARQPKRLADAQEWIGIGCLSSCLWRDYEHDKGQ